MKRVLVTGAAGFIGSHLTEQLLARGCEVTAFVHYNFQNSWGWLDTLSPATIDKLKVFAGDIRDPNGVRSAIKGCDTVFHLAALIGIPYSYHSPDTYIDTNIKGTLNVLQASRELGVEKIVHTSTSEVYGTARTVPISESHPLQAQSPYAASKIGADQLAMSFFLSFKTPVATIRPFNTYGPRQSARAVIPSIITQIAGGAKQIKLGATTPTRDFNYVKDTASGFISIAENPSSTGEVINIGSNYEISIAETAQMIARLMGADVSIVSEEMRVRPAGSEVERLWADNSKAAKLIGWKPEFGGVSGFERGLKQTIDWFVQPSNLSKYKSLIYNI